MTVKWQKGKRLDPKVFNLPAEKIRSGWYSDTYFVRTREVLLKDNHHPSVTMQVFAKRYAVVCGLDEAIAIIKLCSGDPSRISIRALYDGDEIEPWETVMHIEGDYSSFAHLETVYLGVLARRTMVATAVKKVVEAAHPKEVFFFPARFDHYSVQTGDGYAAFISGALGVSTDANAAWWGAKGMGTVPHSLIAAYDGDTVKAALAFDKLMPPEIKRIVLVDFDNDCVRTSLDVAKALGKRLWGVRLDTAQEIRDISVEKQTKPSMGVCPQLVWNVRKELDHAGYEHVRIVISGGFTAEKIRDFVHAGVPFDAVGVGSAFFKERIDFTADVVRVNGKPCAKVGREFRDNPRLKEVVL